MKAQGNSLPEVCASNLLRLSRGEIPFDRLRGRNTALIDRPNATAEAEQDIEWLLENYEPRVNAAEIAMRFANDADYSFFVNIEKRSADE